MASYDALYAELALPIAARCFAVKRDTPRPGVTLYDMQPLLSSRDTQNCVRALFAKHAGRTFGLDDARPTHVLALESRGYFPGMWLAARFGAALVPVRKLAQARRLVCSDAELVISPAYGTEYAAADDGARLCVGANVVPRGARVLIVDDVLATGGSLRAAAALADMLGAHVCAHAVLLALDGVFSGPPLGAPVLALFSAAQDGALRENAGGALPASVCAPPPPPPRSA